MNSLNVNPARKIKDLFEIVPPRDEGRGKAKKSIGTVHKVTSGPLGFYIDDVLILSRPSANPRYLDICFDQLDRPQFCWVEAGRTFIYFYNGLLSDYQFLDIGENAAQPILANDYLLDGTNTVLAYLKNQKPHYRLQADRFGIEYLWNDSQEVGIKAFGYGVKTNSIQLYLG